MQSFLPVEITPGYFTHQTQRSDEKGTMHRDPWRRADWDYLGWKYSVISSLATAPFNHVANFLPARDTAEFKAFSKADQQWLKGWLDWTDKNMDILRNVQFIMTPCGVGHADGTAAFKGDKGFVFLFNSNYGRLSATSSWIHPSASTAGSEFVVTELYPRARQIDRQAGPGRGESAMISACRWKATARWCCRLRRRRRLRSPCSSIPPGRPR